MSLEPRNTPKQVGGRDPSQKNVPIPSETPRTSSGLLSVIGGDQRQMISQTEQNPWRMICSLSLRNENGTQFVGSGWMVGPRTVITAGHCVLDPRYGQMAEIDVMPGRHHDKKPFGSVKVRAPKTRVHETWKSGFDPDFDIGALLLDEPLGDETGWFGYAAAAEKDLLNLQMNVAGYPRDVQGMEVLGRELWWHNDAIKELSERRAYYATDTSGGQSGSPVWAFNDDDALPVVVGVHAYGASLDAQKSDGATGTVNSAPRIDDSIADLIDAWIQESG